MVKDTYESPLSARYASKEMKYIFSPDKNSEHGESSGLLLQNRKKNSDSQLHRSRLTNSRLMLMISTMKLHRKERKLFVMM